MNRSTIIAWWGQRPWREKLMLVAVACATLIALADALVSAPLEKKLKRAVAELASTQAELDRHRSAKPSAQADLQLQESRLRERLLAAQASSEQMHRRIADATRLPETLRAIVGTVGAVRVLELDLAGDIEGGPSASGKLYRLPISLKVSGNWAELQQLLLQIERHADALQWSALALDASDWPAIQLTLKAHVWSHAPRWGASS